MTAKKPADQATGLREHAAHAQETMTETAEKLSDKLDVPGRAAQGVEFGAAKAQQVGRVAQDATAQVKDTATRALDQAEKKLDDLPEAVREPAQRTVRTLRQRPTLVVLGLVGLFALWRLLSRRSHN